MTSGDVTLQHGDFVQQVVWTCCQGFFVGFDCSFEFGFCKEFVCVCFLCVGLGQQSLLTLFSILARRIIRLFHYLPLLPLTRISRSLRALPLSHPLYEAHRELCAQSAQFESSLYTTGFDGGFGRRVKGLRNSLRPWRCPTKDYTSQPFLTKDVVSIRRNHCKNGDSTNRVRFLTPENSQ